MLRHIPTGRMYHYSQDLWNRGDMEEVTEEQLGEEEDIGTSSIAIDNGDDDDMSGDIFAGFEDLPASPPPRRRRATKRK